MSLQLKTKQQFIELRADGVSFDKISKKLKVSKSTLITWAKEYELEIENFRAISYESFQEQYEIGQKHRLKMWSEQLDAVRAELKKRGLSDMPTSKLIDLLDTITDKIKQETYKVEFKSEAIEKICEIEPLKTIEQDTWRG